LPDDATGYVRVCHDDGKWCLRARARNGHVVLPNDGYTEREHAVDGLATLREVLRSPLIDAGD
jgi:uncharacterized protein YegP (UPF0339 family)